MHTNSTIPRPMNVGSVERLVSIIAGSFLLLDSLANKHFRWTKLFTSGYLIYRGASGNCPLYSWAGKRSVIPSKNINIRTEMYIDKPREEVYLIWRKLENLPLFMKHLKSVKEVHDDISEWKANIPGKLTPVHWKAKIVRDIPGEMISWCSLPDSMIENAGKVEFRDTEGATGTDVFVTITYQPPLGLLGNAAGEFFHPALENIVRDDIFNFKQYVEASNEKRIIIKPSSLRS